MQQLGSGVQQLCSQQLGAAQHRERWQNRPALASWLQTKINAATANRGTRIFAFIG
jgi:hypothetical protein